MNTPGEAPHHTLMGWGPQHRVVAWDSLLQPLNFWAEKAPDKEFLVTARESLTYRQAVSSVAATRDRLRDDWGIGPGSTVVVATSNTWECVVAVLGVIACGGVCVMVSTANPPERTSVQVEAMTPDLVIGPPSTWAPDGVNRVSAVDLVSRGDGAAVEICYERDRLDEPVLIFFTTGSTAASKPVAQSSYNVLVNTVALGRHLRLEPGRRLLGVLPICFANGLQLSVLAPMVSGATCVLLEEFHPMTYLQQLADAQASVASLVPSMLDALTRTRNPPSLPRLEFFVTAAAPLARDTARATFDKLGKRIVQGYGLSETTNFSTLMPLDLSEAEYRELVLDADIPAVGTALFGNEVVVLDSEGRGVELGEIGEVCMRGHSVMLGYEGNPEATDEAFQGGWFHSGDLGRLNASSDPGRPVLTLTGRLKNIVKIGGVAVSLEELERAIGAVRGVVDVACEAEAHASLGERVVANVVVESSALSLEDAMWKAVGGVLSNGRAAVTFRYVPVVERTANGKLLRTRPGTRHG